MRSRLNHVTGIGTLAALSLVRTVSAEAIECTDNSLKTFQDYIKLGNAGCTIDDKTFSGFFYGLVGVGSGPTAAQINVTPLTTARNPGFTFTSKPGLGGWTGSLAFVLGFNAAVAANGNAITDASLNMNQYVVGNGAELTITEFLCLGGTFQNQDFTKCTTQPAGLTSIATDVQPPTVSKSTASTTFQGTNMLGVDASGILTPNNSSVSLFQFTEQFSEVPEPSSLLLVLPFAFALTMKKARGHP